MNEVKGTKEFSIFGLYEFPVNKPLIKMSSM